MPGLNVSRLSYLGFAGKLYVRFKFAVWARLRANHFHSYYLSHALFGEDMVVRAILGNQRVGFYVDVGAHHPIFDSNTYFFYTAGWKGINIDAAPGSMNLFELLRPRDTNLEVCVSDQTKKETFYTFDSAVYNTVDTQMMQRAVSNGRTVTSCQEIQARTLNEILEDHLPSDTGIDYLNIDLEGMDELVLRSMDWKRFRPRVISFEYHASEVCNLQEIPAMRYLHSQGYRFEAKCGSTFIVRVKESETDC